jgi:hypothetical protein
MIALGLASVGVIYLYEGIGLSLTAAQRQEFYDRCSRFMATELPVLLVQCGRSPEQQGQTRPLGGGSFPIQCTVNCEAGGENGLKDLVQVRVRWASEGTRMTMRAELTTYYSPLVLAGKPLEQGGRAREER